MNPSPAQVAQHQPPKSVDLRFQNLNVTNEAAASGTNPIPGQCAAGGSVSNNSWFKTAMGSSYGAAAFIAIIVLLFLAGTQPPFVKSKETPLSEPKLSLLYLGIWSLITFLVVLLIPPVHSYCCSGGSFAAPNS